MRCGNGNDYHCSMPMQEYVFRYPGGAIQRDSTGRFSRCDEAHRCLPPEVERDRCQPSLPGLRDRCNQLWLLSGIRTCAGGLLATMLPTVVHLCQLPDSSNMTASCSCEHLHALSQSVQEILSSTAIWCLQRPAVREGILFIARTIVQRTQPGQRQSVKNAEYLCHVHVKADAPLAAIVVADAEYPVTAAFSVIHKVGAAGSHVCCCAVLRKGGRCRQLALAKEIAYALVLCIEYVS
jgi:hypothetical protein